ncbi:MFS transporter [Gynurincola endophyticus]|uniref:MFS transporter n=1 Tax=Gynurincola endophyticus TaxID=2479004 RepID=UPI000F8D2F0F|nr:MFS transporter [Gynurincola endophyticus]
MQTASKKVVNGWAMYDWANSVYNLVITTSFFPLFYEASTKAHFGGDEVSFFGRKFINTALYNYSFAASYLFVVLLYPLLSSIADIRGNKKSFMHFFCLIGSVGCSLLYFFDGSNIEFGLICSMLAAIGYAGSLVFYNAFLPEIAAAKDRDRISAKGFSLGYIGGVILQLVGFALVQYFSAKGDTSEGIKITFLLVGLWWYGFAWYSFARLPKGKPDPEKKDWNVFTAGFTEMKKVFRQVQTMPVLKRFLRSIFFYNMGVQTVMLAATLFGSKILGLPESQLLITLLVIQVVAIGGAYGVSWLATRFGNFNALMICIVIWMGICVGAYYEAYLASIQKNTVAHFYLLAVAVGLVMGGIQSVSRSTYSKLMPETKDTTSFFSYYDMTEKLAIVLGMFTFGFVEELTGSMANSILSLCVFFLIGFVFLYSAKVKQQKQAL